MLPALARATTARYTPGCRQVSRWLHSARPVSDLTGLHCTVTGASSGIGRAAACLLASCNATCTLLGRDRTRLAETESLLAPGSHRAIVGDVGEPATWAADHWDEKPVHILVNAAGIAHSSLFVRTNHATIDGVIRTNLTGTILACQRLGKKMLRNESATVLGGRGCIVNVASLLAVKSDVGSSIYSASKAGIVSLTRSLALELAPLGVRTNCVLPGYVRTKMTDAMTASAQESAVSSVPLGRMGTVDEVAHAILFLIGNGYANNCVLNLDGGLSATVGTDLPTVYSAADVAQ